MSYADLRKGRYSGPGREYSVITVLQGRPLLFPDLYLARIFIRVLRESQEAGLGVWIAWVLMPNHFHGLVSLGAAVDLSALMQRVKGAIAAEINKRLGRRGTCWQPGSTTIRCAGRRTGWRPRYIVANPLRVGLVKRLGDYPHWDSVWL